jgi:hypothetical protein
MWTSVVLGGYFDFRYSYVYAGVIYNFINTCLGFKSSHHLIHVIKHILRTYRNGSVITIFHIVLDSSSNVTTEELGNVITTATNATNLTISNINIEGKIKVPPPFFFSSYSLLVTISTFLSIVQLIKISFQSFAHLDFVQTTVPVPRFQIPNYNAGIWCNIHRRSSLDKVFAFPLEI